MLRVGIDGGCWANRRGYGRFLRELLEALAGRDDRIEYTIFLDSEGWQSFDLNERVHAVLVETSSSVGSRDGQRKKVAARRNSDEPSGCSA